MTNPGNNMIENNPSNVSSGFEMLLEEVEAEIDFFRRIGSRAFETATTRNRLVVEMASAVVVAHAAPGSKMEALCRDILATGKLLYTFDHPANAALIQAGARPITPETDWSHILKCEDPSRGPHSESH